MKYTAGMTEQDFRKQVHNQGSTKKVSAAQAVAKAVAGVNELVEQAKRVGLTPEPPKPNEVVREFAAVNREGKNIGVLKMERMGPTQPAQQYAPSAKYYEPRIPEGKRREMEAEAAGIRTQLESPGLSPGNRIRLEQALKKIESILAKAGSGPAVRENER